MEARYAWELSQNKGGNTNTFKPYVTRGDFV